MLDNIEEISNENGEVNFNYFNKENLLFKSFEYKSNYDEEYSTNCSLNSNEDKENIDTLNLIKINEKPKYIIDVIYNINNNNIKNSELSLVNNFNKLNINAKPFIKKRLYNIDLYNEQNVKNKYNKNGIKNIKNIKNKKKRKFLQRKKEIGHAIDAKI